MYTSLLTTTRVDELTNESFQVWQVLNVLAIS